MSDITPTVSAIGQMHFEGNIIPHPWYKAITFPSGKPDVNAILILAEIVYWYRPTILRDEATGEVVSVRKKFKADMLQRSYQSFADQFGFTKRQCEDAIARLVKLVLIKKETRIVDTPTGRIGNVLYIEPIPEALQRISLYDTTYKDARPNVEAYTPHGSTNTKTTNTKSSQRKGRAPRTPSPEKRRDDADTPRKYAREHFPDL